MRSYSLIGSNLHSHYSYCITE